MMHLKAIFYWLYDTTSNYNLFQLEENDYDDDDDDDSVQPRDPAMVLRCQKYSTRLYVVLLLGKYKA